MKALSEHRGDSEELHRMFGRSKQRMCDSSQQSVRSSKQMLYACQILWHFQSRIRMTSLVLNSVTGGNQFWLSVANLNMPLWRGVFCELFTLGTPFRIWSSPISEVSHEIHMLWRSFKLYPSNSRWLLKVWSLGVVEASLTSVSYQSFLDIWV